MASVPGVGGINRGRGDAMLELSGETKLAGERFRDSPLPEGAVLPEDLGEVVDRKPGTEAPAEAPEAAGPRRAIVEGEKAAAWRPELSRRSREIARRYFEANPDK